MHRKVNGIETGYSVTLWKTYTKYWDKCRIIFCEFEILCLWCTLQDVGWPVCRHGRHELCTAKSSTKWYRPKIINAGFHRHVDFHKKETKANFDPLVVVSREQKNYYRFRCRCRCTRQSHTELLWEEARHDHICRSASCVSSLHLQFNWTWRNLFHEKYGVVRFDTVHRRTSKIVQHATYIYIRTVCRGSDVWWSEAGLELKEILRL